MRNLKRIIIVLLATTAFGCDGKKEVKITDPSKFASAYCDCMKRNGAPKDYLYALAVCDGELIQKNRLFRLQRINMRYNDTISQKIDYETAGKVALFMNTVDSITQKNCCDAVLKCPDRLKK